MRERKVTRGARAGLSRFRRPPQRRRARVKVLHRIGHGQDTKSIVDVLCRSKKTIETYRSRIKSKLRLKNTTVLAQVAWQFVHGVRVGGH